MDLSDSQVRDETDECVPRDVDSKAVNGLGADNDDRRRLQIIGHQVTQGMECVSHTANQHVPSPHEPNKEVTIAGKIDQTLSILVRRVVECARTSVTKHYASHDWENGNGSSCWVHS